MIVIPRKSRVFFAEADLHIKQQPLIWHLNALAPTRTRGRRISSLFFEKSDHWLLKRSARILVMAQVATRDPFFSTTEGIEITDTTDVLVPSSTVQHFQVACTTSGGSLPDTVPTPSAHARSKLVPLPVNMVHERLAVTQAVPVRRSLGLLASSLPRSAGSQTPQSGRTTGRTELILTTVTASDSASSPVSSDELPEDHGFLPVHLKDVASECSISAIDLAYHFLETMPPDLLGAVERGRAAVFLTQYADVFDSFTLTVCVTCFTYHLAGSADFLVVRRHCFPWPTCNASFPAAPTPSFVPSSPSCSCTVWCIPPGSLPLLFFPRQT